MKQTLQLLMVLSISGLIAGCKLAAIVVEGGYVHTEKRPDCLEGSICIIEVTSTNYTESFTAFPDEGWYFEKWSSGDRFFCGGSTSPVCKLSLTAAKGNTVIEELVASSETFYLMPVFKPAQDIITLNGKEWYQPYLFVDLSWNEINAVCPDGTCTGTLKGQDMTGWTWASIEDINALFNYYLGSEELGPGPDRFSGYYNTSTWATTFFLDGWQPNYREDGCGGCGIFTSALWGWMRNLSESEMVYIGGIKDNSNEGAAVVDFIVTDLEYADKNWAPNWVNGGKVGGWFYRTP